MKYETPELSALTPAIDAIQAGKNDNFPLESQLVYEGISAYEDWE
jgi:hypothetical protein